MIDISNINGIICPIVTPFDQSGAIDCFSLQKIVDFLISEGINGLMINGSTGEGLLLSLDERKTISEKVVNHNAGRVPIIIHTGCINTRDTIDLTKHASKVGANAGAIIVPYFYDYDDNSLFNHFISIADATPNFPLFIYTFPGNAKNGLSPSLLNRLLIEAPNIVGVKSSNPSLVRFQEYLEVSNGRAVIFNGHDGLIFPSLALGASGHVSGNANVFPNVFALLLRFFKKDDYQDVIILQKIINQIRLIFMDGFNPALYKAGLSIRGMPISYVRSPMRELTQKEWRNLEEGIHKIDKMIENSFTNKVLTID